MFLYYSFYKYISIYLVTVPQLCGTFIEEIFNVHAAHNKSYSGGFNVRVTQDSSHADL
jgi:hypothetical protein